MAIGACASWCAIFKRPANERSLGRVKHIPERTFRHLIRLADSLGKPEARVELRAELHRIAREQPLRPRGAQSPIAVLGEPAGAGDLEL
jgi:hypothetical protein